MPTLQEWICYGYTGLRDDQALPFVSGWTYLYPTGNSPTEANCLKACGTANGNPDGKRDFSDYFTCRYGHASVGNTKPGVNGLFDMGANVWEWADLDCGQFAAIMGGPWWYESAQMRTECSATKLRDMAARYIGFRCIGDLIMLLSANANLP